LISQDQLADIAGWLNEHGAGESCLPLLRQRYPGMHFTWCMDDDVSFESVAREEAGFNLYLVDSSSHCLAFTRDADAATGVVIAEVIEE
jgi:Family of unknown function (DUF6129)